MIFSIFVARAVEMPLKESKFIFVYLRLLTFKRVYFGEIAWSGVPLPSSASAFSPSR